MLDLSQSCIVTDFFRSGSGLSPFPISLLLFPLECANRIDDEDDMSNGNRQTRIQCPDGIGRLYRQGGV